MFSSDKRKKVSCSDKSYLVIKSHEVEIAKEVKRSDRLWRFACGNVFLIYQFVKILGILVAKMNYTKTPMSHNPYVFDLPRKGGQGQAGTFAF